MPLTKITFDLDNFAEKLRRERDEEIRANAASVRENIPNEMEKQHKRSSKREAPKSTTAIPAAQTVPHKTPAPKLSKTSKSPARLAQPSVDSTKAFQPVQKSGGVCPEHAQKAHRSEITNQGSPEKESLGIATPPGLPTTPALTNASSVTPSREATYKQTRDTVVLAADFQSPLDPVKKVDSAKTNEASPGEWRSEHRHPAQVAHLRNPGQMFHPAPQGEYSQNMDRDAHAPISNWKSNSPAFQPAYAPMPIQAQSDAITTSELEGYLAALRINSTSVSADKSGMGFEVRYAPIFSSQVKDFATKCSLSNAGVLETFRFEAIQFNQYALLGHEITSAKRGAAVPEMSPLLLNVDAPWSAFICGSQGSGKSYTLSVMLENCLFPAKGLVKLPKPLAGVLFHYDTHQSFFPCEAAFLASHIPVTVLVSPSAYFGRQKVYSKIPNVRVRPLLFKPSQMNMKRMLQLMAVDDKEGAPLYSQVVTRILRELSLKDRGEGQLDWNEFCRLLKQEADFSVQQHSHLKMRLELLESFMEHGYSANSVLGMATKTMIVDNFEAQPGTLTIIDLTDSFVDQSSACSLFDTCLGLFLENDKATGHVFALDGAHKFFSDNVFASKLTESLVQLIREHRHRGARVIISTQEPIVSPKLLDLCSISVVHRFTSPAWVNVLTGHLAGVADEHEGKHVFAEIVNLGVGESLVFAPSAMLDVLLSTTAAHGVEGSKYVGRLGSTPVKMRTRTRVTSDGGGSVMATTGGPNPAS